MSATATTIEQAPNRLAGFVPVQVRTLRSTKTDATDLFVQYEPQAEPVLYCRAGSRPDEQQFAELAEAGVDTFIFNMPTSGKDAVDRAGKLFASRWG